MIQQATAEVQVLIGQLQVQKHIPQQSRKQQISQLRQSLISIKGTDSSFQVITSIANTMIGSSIIVYPIIFVKDGIFGSFLVLLAIGAILFSTCRLLLLHNKHDQPQFGTQIKRILGNRWALLNSITNIVLIYIVSIAYFMLIAANFFDITASIFQQISDNYHRPTAKIDLTKYSAQYACIISLIFIAPLVMRRDVEFLLKFFKYTIYCVFFYGFFILAAFIKVLADGSLSDNWQKYHYFDPDFSTVAGAFALSFLLHPVGAPILKRNINQKNNMRDLFLGYCLTAGIYVYVGFIGGLTCANQVQGINDSSTSDNYSTIFDCFLKGSTNSQIGFFIFGKIVQLGILVQNMSVMPILSFLTRKQFLQLFHQQRNKKIGFYAYNISILFLCLVVTFFDVDVSIVLSFNGAIVGFFMAYAIPIYSHLTCLFGKMSNSQRLQRAELLTSTETDQQTTNALLQCNEHKAGNKNRSYIIYGGLMIVGVALGLFKLIAFFK